MKLSNKEIQEFANYLYREEKSAATQEKYLRDVRVFCVYADDNEITKELVVAWKRHLMEQGFAVRSINSMLASINSLLDFLGLSNCKSKNIRMQQKTYCTEDKELTKAVWRNAGLPVLPHLCLHCGDVGRTGWDTTKLQQLLEPAERDFGYPLFVKPCSAGSSVGAAKAANFQQLVEALQEAFKWDYKVLIEPGLNPREIECSVTGNGADFSPIVGEEHLHEESLSVDELRAELQQSEPDVNKVRAYIPGEIAPTHQFYDYDAKYTDPNGARLIIPAELTDQQREEIRSIAIRAYKALDCTGLSRVDFFLEKDTGRLYLNEINTMPGFTSISMFPKMCQAAGLDYSQLLDLIVRQGLDRFQQRSALQTSRS